jgi:hypothetical protein
MTPVPCHTDIEQFRAALTRHLGLQYEDGKLDYLADVLCQRMQPVELHPNLTQDLHPILTHPI